MARISDFELGWLCGILEGEGTFGFNSGTQRIGLQMTDEDAVYRVASLFERITEGLAEVHSVNRTQPNPNHKDMFGLMICGERARVVMRLVVNHMSYRRRQRIWQSLNGFTPDKVDVLRILSLVKET